MGERVYMCEGKEWGDVGGENDMTDVWVSRSLVIPLKYLSKERTISLPFGVKLTNLSDSLSWYLSSPFDIWVLQICFHIDKSDWCIFRQAEPWSFSFLTIPDQRVIAHRDMHELFRGTWSKFLGKFSGIYFWIVSLSFLVYIHSWSLHDK